MNHQTGFDQFFVGMTFRQPVYYVATEDIFSLGWLSDLLRWLVAPIPIKKQTTDIQAVKNCIKVAREGGSICIAPEGNRTFHGRTVYMNPSIASMAKKLALPIAFFRIEGGYGIQPRWSDVIRGGSMKSYISRVMEPEEFENMTKDQLAQVIRQELYVDEGNVTGEYPHPKSAEFLERAMYVCPHCGLTTFESSGDIIRCTKCDRKIRHLATKELEGIGEPFPHRFVADWYDWQNDYIADADLSSLTEAPVYEETVELRKVHVYKYKELLKEKAVVRLYGDRITLDNQVFPFADLSAVVVLGKNKVNLYTGNDVLQLKGDKRFNALKYVHFFHKYKNTKAGDTNGKFLGL
jgi:DNA-directed RNA polymerase subunit RPC12/RpoP